MTGLQGKTVLVTGASSGIGEATARHLASKGAKVVLGARRADRLERIVAEIAEAGGEAHARALDVTDLTDMQAFAGFARERLGAVDVLVNNAGVMPLSPLAALKTEEWNRMIDVNIRGVLNGIASVLPEMLARGSGHVVNLASIGAHQVWPSSAVYCATKYAVWAISDGLRQETDRLRVTVVSPGVTTSELANTISDPATREGMAAFRAIAIPPEAIARAVAYAVEQPEDVDVNEVVVRPTASPN